ncbi:hypothetical protein CMO90_01130 [Candidatus Woesearchaeota archaeon]|nr:hypothetical protein [Candidatus Woesearchaeota archaeon]
MIDEYIKSLEKTLLESDMAISKDYAMVDVADIDTSSIDDCFYDVCCVYSKHELPLVKVDIKKANKLARKLNIEGYNWSSADIVDSGFFGVKTAVFSPGEKTLAHIVYRQSRKVSENNVERFKYKSSLLNSKVGGIMVLTEKISDFYNNSKEKINSISEKFDKVCVMSRAVYYKHTPNGYNNMTHYLANKITKKHEKGKKKALRSFNKRHIESLYK